MKYLQIAAIFVAAVIFSFLAEEASAGYDELVSNAERFSGDVDVFGVLQDPKSLLDEVEEYFNQVCEIPEFKETCVPWIFPTDEVYGQFRDSIEDSLAEFRDVESISLGLDDGNVVVVVQCEKENAVKLKKKLEIAGSLFEEQANSKSTVATSRFIGQFLSVPWVFGEFSGGIVISNSAVLLSETLQRCSEQANGKVRNSLFANRAFKRGLAHLQGNIAHNDFVFYLKPISFAEYLSPYIEVDSPKKVLHSYGVDGLASCVGVADIEQTSGLRRVDVLMYMPYTVPRAGLAAIWGAGLPIQELPDVFSIESVEEYYFEAENIDLASEDEALRKSFERLNGKGSYYGKKSSLESICPYRIKYGVRREFEDGLISHGVVKILKCPKSDDAIDAIQRSISEKKPKYPVVETLLEGQTAWFQSDTTYIDEFEHNYGRRPKTEQDLYLNSGFVFTDSGWIIKGPKSECAEVVKALERDVSVRNGFADRFFSTRCLQGDLDEPSWIQLNTNYLRVALMNGKLLEHLRKNHKAGGEKIWEDSSQKRLITFSPLNDQDRLFLIGDIPVRLLNLNWSRSLATFNCDDEVVRFGWCFVSEPNADE